MKIVASKTGVEGIYKNNDNLILQFPYYVGSSRIALQKILGEEWEIGNKQVRTYISKLGNDWEGILKTVLRQIDEFQRKVLADLIP